MRLPCKERVKMSSYRGKNVMITGGLGFIGANLAKKLVDLGAHVLVVDSLIPEYGGNLHNVAGIKDKIEINISDVRDAHSMKYLIKNHDYLFNLAGQTSHMDSMRNPFTDLEINCTAQLSILEACRLYSPTIKIVYASTRQIYGKPDYLPVDEIHPIRPIDVNGINKMAGEYYHILYNNVYDVKTCVLRLTNTIGPCMRVKDARQTFVGIWIRKILENSAIEVWGGNQLRDFNYVDDCVDAMLLAMSNDRTNGMIFNLGSSEVVNLGVLAQMLIEINGSGKYIVKAFPEERKKIDIGDYYSDYKLIRETIGWEPRVSLKEGLEKTIKFYRENFEHYV